MIVEYTLAKECEYEDIWCTCYYQYGKCGRVFVDNLMIGDDDTTVEEDQE